MISVDFWEGRYESGTTPWDLGGPSPHFVELLQQKPEWLNPGKMAVLGSGLGHDAVLFAQAGFEVLGFDYSPGAIERAKALYGDKVRFEQADIFTLPDSPWAGQFDYILEHLCFCAILPEQQKDYVRTAQALLKPDGLLVGVLWEHGRTGGPPFNITAADVQSSFGTAFDMISSTDKTATAPRKGTERLVVLRRRA